MPLDQYTALDVQRIVAFPLNNDGSFNLSSVEDVCSDGGIQDLFEGIEFAAPTSFDVSFGAPRQIPVVAQGQVQATFLLPSIEAKTGTIRTAYDKLSLDALLAGVNVDTVAAGKFMPMDTDKSGQETLVALLLQQLQSKDDSGNIIQSSYVVHRSTIVPSPHSYNAEPLVKVYDIAMSRSQKRMWGESYSLATHKCTEATMDIGITSTKFDIGVWRGDNVLTTFNMPANKYPTASGNVKVWDFDTGAARAGSWNANFSVFTPTVKPPLGLTMIVTYEHA